MKHYLESMTPTQREATLHMNGPAMVLASPGSGKTRIVTYRIVNLIEEGVNPAAIAAITFTNKAANEMRERVGQVLPQHHADAVYISTFHAFCARLLRMEHEAAGLHKKFVICDSADTKNYLTQAISLELGVSPKKVRGYRDHRSISYVGRYISSKKQTLMTPEDVLDAAMNKGDEDKNERLLRKCYERYQAALDRNRSVDFDDLIMKAVLMLRRREDVREKYSKRIHYMMVDEYQDTNLSQYELVSMLTSFHNNIAVVGDVDQSIYAFRGADIENIRRLEADHPEVKIFFMEENFRSTPQIAHVANELIAFNQERKEKTIRAVQGDGAPVRCLQCMDNGQEAGFIVDEIKSRVKKGELRYKDCAVIYRTHAKSRKFEELLKAENIPHKVIGGVNFYERQAVKDILSFVRLRLNPFDEASFTRIYDTPPRGFGERSYEKMIATVLEENCSVVKVFKDQRYEKLLKGSPLLGARKLRNVFKQLYAHGTGKVAPIMKTAIEASGYRVYLEGDTGNKKANRTAENNIGLIDELLQSAKDFDDKHGGGLLYYFEFVSLMQSADEDEEGDHVTLMSCHAAKGLEFPVVYVVGAIQGSMPIIRQTDDAGNVKPPQQLAKDLEEERRVMFVAATRAERELTVSTYKRRPMYGSWEDCSPSQFIEEMGDTVKYENIGDSALGKYEAAMPKRVRRGRYRNRSTSRRVKMF